jgi:hypothetical protein
MTSAKKVAANRKNAKSSTGPTTELGKSRSSHNSTKHGVLADELIIDEVDRPEFEALRAELQSQLSPTTALQRIAFDRIMCALWRQKLALRLDAKRLRTAFDQIEENESPAQEDVPLESTLQRKWYGESGTDVRAAIRFLSELRQDVEENGWIHADKWKQSVIRVFGDEYFSMLTEWIPPNPDAIRMAEALVAKSKRFDPPLSKTSPESKPEIADPRLGWQVGVKLIDLMRMHLEGLSRIKKLSMNSDSTEHTTSSLELAGRYLTSSTREVERAVGWFLFVRAQGL